MVKFKIKEFFLCVFIIATCLFMINCSSKRVKVSETVVQKKRVKFEFIPNGFQLETTGNGFVDVYPDKLDIVIIKGEIRINPIYSRFKTSSAYAIQIGISRYFPGEKSFKILATGEKIIINKIFQSRDDFYTLSNLKFSIPNIKKEDLKNSRITLTIFSDGTSHSSTNYAHSNDENTISTLFDF